MPPYAGAQLWLRDVLISVVRAGPGAPKGANQTTPEARHLRDCLLPIICATAYSGESFQPRCFQRNNPVRPRRFTCKGWNRSYSAAAWLDDLR
jgi:hypothetical protein